MKLTHGLIAGSLAAALTCTPLGLRQSFADEPANGQHDFDFNIGIWKTHIRRVLDPLSGSTNSIELEGTVTVRKVWEERA
jgi:hypothetical protein